MNIEHGTFTPLVFSVSGGMGKECSMFHKHVAERLAIKTGERYEKIISTIRCKLSFLILKLALMCVRGSRSHNVKTIDEFELVSNESAKWRAQNVPSVPYVHSHPTCPTCSTRPTCPRAQRTLHVSKYILQTGKLKILVLMKSNEGSFTDVFKGAEV